MSKPIPSFQHSLVSRDERGVYTLQIQGIKSLNILSTPVIVGVTQALRWLAQQPDARAVVLRGNDKAFVGGANIFEMAELDPQSARLFISALGELCDAAREIPVPTIARIQGLCLGAGLELAAACDIRLGAHDSVFGMPEVHIGIPSVIHAVLLPALIGPGATRWLLLTGETVAADQALRWGFLQFACEPDELDQLVEQSVAPIVASGPRAMRSQKSLLDHWENESLRAGIERSVEAFGEAFESSEPREYMAPFLARKTRRELA